MRSVSTKVSHTKDRFLTMRNMFIKNTIGKSKDQYNKDKIKFINGKRIENSISSNVIK